MKLSLRVPPTLNPKEKAEEFKKILETNPPYNSKVTVEILGASPGWSAPKLQPYLAKIIENCSYNFYGNKPMAYGEGGSIPLMY